MDFLLRRGYFRTQRGAIRNGWKSRCGVSYLSFSAAVENAIAQPVENRENENAEKLINRYIAKRLVEISVDKNA